MKRALAAGQNLANLPSVKIEDLTGVFLIGAIASVGAIFTGPPGLGITGLVIFGGLLALAITSQSPPALREPISEPDPLQHAPLAPQPKLSNHVPASSIEAVESHWRSFDPKAFRSEVRWFFKQRRNMLSFDRNLRSDFRYALVQVRFEAINRGECLTISRWLLRARAHLKRQGKLP